MTLLSLDLRKILQINLQDERGSDIRLLNESLGGNTTASHLHILITVQKKMSVEVLEVIMRTRAA